MKLLFLILYPNVTFSVTRGYSAHGDIILLTTGCCETLLELVSLTDAGYGDCTSYGFSIVSDNIVYVPNGYSRCKTSVLFSPHATGNGNNYYPKSEAQLNNLLEHS